MVDLSESKKWDPWIPFLMEPIGSNSFTLPKVYPFQPGALNRVRQAVHMRLAPSASGWPPY